jgi:ABC-type bacteriocin/lantibiotic exporter with double-glycine peptidase domain
LLLLLLPFFVIYGIKSRKMLNEISTDKDTGQEEMYRRCKQAIEGFREILIFNRIEYFLSPFADSVMRFSHSASRLHLLNTFYPKIIELLAVMCLFIILLFGVWFSYDVTVLASFLMAFALSAFRLIPSINKLILHHNNIKSYNFVFNYFADAHLNSTLVRHDISRDDEGGAPGLKFENALKVSNLSFNFGDKRILDAINLTINKGDVVGIIGKSGSGKTTLMNLLLGLYAPREGQIQVDEVVLDESTFKKWHRTIGLVPQNLVMIEGTIEENIVFSPGPLEVDHFKLTLAIERSGLKGFIESLPMGLHTPVSESALTLSGGQRQRIAIARALYHSNKFLLFDEATSSLDNEIISVITDSIANLAANGSTILLITHQPVLLKCCTRVYQLEQGAISLVGKEKYEASA